MSRYRKLPPGVKPPLGWVLNRASPLGPRVTRAWLCNEGAGRTLVDPAGRAATALGAGVTWGGGVLLFDGSSGARADTGMQGVPTGASPRTFIIRAYKSNGGSVDVLGGWGDEAGDGGTFGAFVAGTRLYFWGWAGADFDSGLDITPGKRFTAALTYDGTTVRTYLDGRAGTAQAVALNTLTGYAALGANAHSNANYLSGGIDWAVMLDVCLSAGDVAAFDPSQAFAPPSSRSLSAPSAAPPPVANGNLWYYSMLGRGL